MRNPDSDATLALLAWLRDHGSRFPGSAPATIEGMGLGLTAATDLAIEDPILFVPRDLWLTRKTTHTAQHALLESLPEDRLPHTMVRLALLLVLEREEPDSFFRPYLDSLGEPTLPGVLTTQQRELLAGLPLLGWIEEQHTSFASEWRDLHAWLGTAHPDAAARCGNDPRVWSWALGHVMQRCFSVDLEGDEVWVIVPGMDLCNHADEPNAQYFAEDDGWYLEATRPIPRGEQITIRYGSTKTSTDLLLYYGFVTPRNSNDRIKLTLELAPDDPDAAEKRAAIDVLGLTTESLVDASGHVPTAFLNAVILWGLESAAFRNEAPDLEDDKLAVAALERVAEAVESARESFLAMVAGSASLQAPGTAPPAPLRAYGHNVERLHADLADALRAQAASVRAEGGRSEVFVPMDGEGHFAIANVRVGP